MASEVQADFTILIDPGAQVNYAESYKAIFLDACSLSSAHVYYVGLQYNPHFSAGKKRTVRFSVWDATQAQAPQGSVCTAFDGEGVGYTCYRNYPYEEGKRTRCALREFPKIKLAHGSPIRRQDRRR
ncbi:MAG: hypothetical protein R3A47_04645 [Polyangiales bacterium]